LSAFLSGGVADSVETFVGIAPTIPSPAAIGIGSGAVPNAPDIVVSLQAFVLNLKDAANNAGVISPVAAGWRFFAGDSQRTTAILGRVVQRGPGQTWKLAAVHYGDLVSQTLNSLNTLGAEVSKMLTDLVSETLSLLNKDPDMTLLQILGQEYELRMLTLPGLNLEVFWLKANKAGLTDFILPIPSATSNTRLQGGVSGLMEMPKFLASIRPVAASLLKMPQGHGA
jgi:hypothetical protein